MVDKVFLLGSKMAKMIFKKSDKFYIDRENGFCTPLHGNSFRIGLAKEGFI